MWYARVGRPRSQWSDGVFKDATTPPLVPETGWWRRWTQDNWRTLIEVSASELLHYLGNL